MLIDYSTGGVGDPDEYKRVREELIHDPRVRPLLPRFIITCRNLPQFWGFIKQFPHYRERREYIWNSFAPIIEKLELEIAQESPIDNIVAETLVQLDTEHVQEIWDRALERRKNDPEGAITAARTLLESVCKSILDEMQVGYSETADLPSLYKLVSEHLNIAPSQHTEKIFKQILGGCQAVVEGLGSLRNKLGNAHGKGKHPVRPAPRHAELAVNLAGAMAVFLIRTWHFRKSKIAK